MSSWLNNFEDKIPVASLFSLFKLRPMQADTLPSVGLDEAGRGPLAGPVMAACVYIPESARRKRFWSEVTDSKLLSRERREYLHDKIREHCICAAALADVEEIDSLNILYASLYAMQKAYDLCRASLPAEHMALIDGNHCPKDLCCPSRPVIGGDKLHKEISAASILAKVTRDRIMRDLHNEFPAYGWETNAGYSTRDHIAALRTHGVTVHHRRSFAPVRSLLSAA